MLALDPTYWGRIEHVLHPKCKYIKVNYNMNILSQKKEESSDEEEVSNADEETIVDSETMPVMRHDIFNLDHKKVMDKVGF